MPTGETWTLAQRMAAEKESFGFYFSAHPVDNYRHLAEAHGARTFAELAATARRRPTAAAPARHGGLVEDARWRTSAKGRRYLMATLSDSSGQFEATIFDDEVAAAGRRGGQGRAPARCSTSSSTAAPARRRRASRSVALRLRKLARRTRLQIEVEIDDEAALGLLAAEAAEAHGGTGQLRLKARLDGGEAELVLGRDFSVDAELAARIERIDGVTAVRLSVAEAPRLALVS